MADEVHICLLGGFDVTVGGRHVAAGAWRLRKARSVLKLLALAPGHRMHRDSVYDLLWPDLDPAAAANNLHQALHAVRRALATAGAPGDVVLIRDDVLLLGPDGGVRTDLDELAQALRRAADGGSAERRAALALAERELLPEDTFEPWTQEARDAVTARRSALRLALAEALEREGRAAEAVEVLEAAGAGLTEPGHRALMRTLAATGRRPEALAVYERLRDGLRDSSGSDPDPQTRELYRDLLAGSVEDPPDDGAVHRHNLPAQTTSFIGRRREVGEVGELLARSRLLTLTGPGGCGKTRLALTVADRRVEAVRDGVWFVDLAALTDPGFVPEAVATALGLQLSSGTGSRAALVGQLAGRELLLLLDNCEHLIESCAALVAELLARCPGVVVLATSREPLQAYGERTWRVPSLALPDVRRLPPPAELGRFASVRLFAERAAEVVPGFRLDQDNAADVAQICFRLDGIPLALELAAARVRMLAPRQIAERLDDALTLLGQGSRHAVTRHQTLLATLQWSHQLLSPRSGCSSGGWRCSPAASRWRPSSRCAPTAPAPRASWTCSVDWSTNRWCWSNATTTRCATACWRRSGSTPGSGCARAGRPPRRSVGTAATSRSPSRTTRTRRTRSTRTRTRRTRITRTRTAGGRRHLAAARGRPRQPPCRPALGTRRRAPGRAPAGRRPAAVLGRARLPRRGRRRLDDALAAAPEPTPLRARALVGQGVLAIRLGDSSGLPGIGAEIVAIHEARADRPAQATAHYQQALLEWMHGSWDRAAAALDRACDLADGAPTLLSAAAHQRGVAAVCRGDGRAARGSSPPACACSPRSTAAPGRSSR